MNSPYIIFQRRGRKNFLIEDTRTGLQKSLKTSDRREAEKLLAAKNQAQENPALNIALAKAYISQSNPLMATRTWQDAMSELSSHGAEDSQARYAREFKSSAYAIIRNKPIIETTSDDLKAVLKRGGAATNTFLRPLHNLVVGNQWVSMPILTSKQWPESSKKPKRGITTEEQGKILAAEQNEERRNYYELLWLVGAAQTDGAMLTAENIDWNNHVLSYKRRKTRVWAHLRIGESLEELLKRLPQQGFLFPKISQSNPSARAAEFCRRRRLLGLEGISLHSYRYGWAERAYASGYDERYAKAALGHKSSAVHHVYAKSAIVVCPPLENTPATIKLPESRVNKANRGTTWMPAPEIPEAFAA